MLTLFSHDYSKLTTFIFKLYDFDNEGLISKEDVRTLLSYVTISFQESKTNSNLKNKYFKFERETFEDRIETQEEFHKLLDKCFKSEKKIDYTNFLKIIEQLDSNIFLTLLIFLLEKKPFCKKTIENYNFIYDLKIFEDKDKDKINDKDKVKVNDNNNNNKANIKDDKIIYNSPNLFNIQNKLPLKKMNNNDNETSINDMSISNNKKGSKSPDTPNSKLLASPSLLGKLMPSQSISKSPTFQGRKLNININSNIDSNILNTNSTYGKYLNLPDNNNNNNNNNNKQINSLLKFCGNLKVIIYFIYNYSFN
jgi:hypothetical protein